MGKFFGFLSAGVNRFVGFLTTAVTQVTADDWSELFTVLNGQISVPTVVAVLAACVGAGIGLVFMWWGVRKLAHVVMSAFRSGRLSF